MNKDLRQAIPFEEFDYQALRWQKKRAQPETAEPFLGSVMRYVILRNVRNVAPDRPLRFPEVTWLPG